jgi:hypothetical protein
VIRHAKPAIKSPQQRSKVVGSWSETNESGSPLATKLPFSRSVRPFPFDLCKLCGHLGPSFYAATVADLLQVLDFGRYDVARSPAIPSQTCPSVYACGILFTEIHTRPPVIRSYGNAAVPVKLLGGATPAHGFGVTDNREPGRQHGPRAGTGVRVRGPCTKATGT